MTKKPASKSVVHKPVAKQAAKKAAKGKAPAKAAKPGKTTKAAKAPAKPVAKKAAVRPAAKPQAKGGAASAKPAKSKPSVPSRSKPTSQAGVARQAKPKEAKPSLKPVSKRAETVAPSAAPKPEAKAVVIDSGQRRDAGATAPLVAPAPRRPLSGRAAARQAAMPAPAPLPPPTSRFADRFAPPRPPTRQMTKLELDTPRRIQVSDPKLANAWKTKAGRDMTEAEILAMPDSEYMNDKQLDFFKRTLHELKDSLLSNAGETTEHLREDTSIVPDPADRATIEEEHALELRTRDRERKLLKKISQSLARIDAGEYGFCDETGEPIGLARLIARPTATLSLEAQQRRELKQKMFGD